MARAKKSQVAQTAVEQQANDVMTIAAACAELNTTEQSFRLALADIRPDDFDTCEAITKLDFEAVAKALQPKALPAMEEQPETIEEVTEETLDQQPEQPEENTNLPAIPEQQLPTQQPPQQQQYSGLSVQEQILKATSEEVQVMDAVLQARNQVILSNKLNRDRELSEALNQNWQYQKSSYLNTLRQFSDMVQPTIEPTADETDLSAEINNVMGELGKLVITTNSPGV